MSGLEEYLTLVDAQVITGKTKQQLLYAIKKKRLNAVKLLKSKGKRNGYFFTTLKDIDEYLGNYRKKEVKRCIPNCKHGKKLCSKCKKLICINDFYVHKNIFKPEGNVVRKRPYCKDCDLLYKHKKVGS